MYIFLLPLSLYFPPLSLHLFRLPSFIFYFTGSVNLSTNKMPVFFLYQLISLCNISVPVSLFYLYVPILFLVWLLLSPQLQSPLMSLGIANAYIMYIDWLWPSIVELSTNIIFYISCFYSLDKNFHAS